MKVMWVCEWINSEGSNNVRKYFKVKPEQKVYGENDIHIDDLIANGGFDLDYTWESKNYFDLYYIVYGTDDRFSDYAHFNSVGKFCLNN